tara:strand:+ start:836 stop:1291 length:456 start_codon:yes stop_codon:yes gene_type:complete
MLSLTENRYLRKREITVSETSDRYRDVVWIGGYAEEKRTSTLRTEPEGDVTAIVAGSGERFDFTRQLDILILPSRYHTEHAACPTLTLLAMANRNSQWLCHGTRSQRTTGATRESLLHMTGFGARTMNHSIEEGMKVSSQGVLARADAHES